MGEGTSRGMQNVCTSKCDGDKSYSGRTCIAKASDECSSIDDLLRAPMKDNWHDKEKFLRLNRMKCKHLHFYLEQARNEHHSYSCETAATEFLLAVRRAKSLVEKNSHSKWLLTALELWECSQHFIEVLTDLFWWASIMRSGGKKKVEERDDKDKEPVIAKVEGNCLSEQLSEAQRGDKDTLREKVRALVQSNILREGDPEHQLAILLDERLNDQSMVDERLNHQIMGNPPAILEKFSIPRASKIKSWFSKSSTKSGQNGSVLSCEWVYKKRFAVKLCKRSTFKAERGMFKHEYDILDKCRSPFIVGVVGYWDLGGDSKNGIMPILFMEEMECDFEGLVKKAKEQKLRKGTKGFSALETIKLMLPIAKALRFLHGEEVDVAHRDIKPRNIMCSNVTAKDFDDAIVKLIDFGEATFEASKSLKVDKVGTSGYRDPVMSILDPKTGNRKPYDVLKADVFSFAMVFLELLTWRYPWEGTGIQRGPGVQTKLDAGERPPLPDDLPEYLSFIVQCCWWRDQPRRPSFEDICKMLHHAKLLLLDKNYSDDLDNLFCYEDEGGINRSFGDQRFLRY